MTDTEPRIPKDGEYGEVSLKVLAGTARWQPNVKNDRSVVIDSDGENDDRPKGEMK